MSNIVRFNIPESIVGNLGESLHFGGEEEEDEDEDEDEAYCPTISTVEA